MDWLEDFQKRFANNPKFPQIQTLKKGKYHGYIQINFHEGIPMNVNANMHLKPHTYGGDAETSTGGST